MSPPSILPPLICLLLLPIVFSIDQTQSSSYNGVGNQAATAATPTPTSNQTSTPGRRTATPSFAREFLAAHNKVRLNVTHPLFVWDRGLARYARRWGLKRTADCKMIHSYGPYGENLFWGLQEHWSATEAVESWAKEREYYDPQNNACSERQMCGHYTQIIWRDSIKLGCTRVKCQTGGVLMICEYDPPGNYVNESPFVNNNNNVAVSGNNAGTAAAAAKSN